MEEFGSWSVLTTNFLFVLYIAINGVTLAALLHLANAQWRYDVRNLAVSLSALFPVAFVLLVILLLNGEQTFQWLAQGHDGEGGGHHLNGWHNYTFLVIRQIVGFITIAALYGYFIKYQHESTIDSSYDAQRRFRNIAMFIPVGYVLYATMMAWDFEMTMMPGWHSASFGAYHFVSFFHFFLAFFFIFLFVLSRSGKLKNDVPKHIFNFIAQMMLAFTILWTYLFFTQYLIMWYGRLPEEIVRFRNMIGNDLGGVWWTFVAMKFVFPFTCLIFARVRHTPAFALIVACSIFLGTWLERYTWIAGSVSPEYYHIPMTSAFDVVVTVLVAGIAIFGMRWSLHRYGFLKAS